MVIVYIDVTERLEIHFVAFYPDTPETLVVEWVIPID